MNNLHLTIRRLSASNLQKIQLSLPQSTPLLLPKSHFHDRIPAIKSWFSHSTDGPKIINTSFFSSIPQLDHHSGNFEVRKHDQFHRFSAPLSEILCLATPNYTSHSNKEDYSIYLTQTPVSSLPKEMTASLLSPAVKAVLPILDEANSSIWLCFAGKPYTPLHRDPYANLFIQLAGRKKVRLMAPADGERVWMHVRKQIGASVSGQGRMRDEDMMLGAEADLLERVVWCKADEWDGDDGRLQMCEAELDEGDAVVIPKQLWHSLRGMNDGVNGSVCYISVAPSR